MGDAEAGFSARSLLCRVRTALPEGARDPVRIAIAACIGRSAILPEYVDPDDLQPGAPWESMLRAAEQEYDVFIHLGDQGYLDEVYDAGGSYAQYLAAWGVLHGGGYRDVYPRSGLYFTWDDHEVTNNGTVDPWTTDPTELQRIDAHTDTQPGSGRGTPVPLVSRRSPVSRRTAAPLLPPFPCSFSSLRLKTAKMLNTD